jgi:glycosyltransferase involved in cell wall biosynthesis
MVNKGMQVQMITTHNELLYEKRDFEGISVHYLPVRYSSDMTYARRFAAFLKFVFGAIRLSSKLKKTDIIFATSTPLTVGLVALWLKWRRDIPFIFEVRDLWPEAPIQLGVLRNVLFKWCATTLEKTIYKAAVEIIALSPGIEAGVVEKAPGAKVVMIPNMADIDFFQAGALKPDTKEKFTIGYFGALGLANNVDYIIEIAKACKYCNMPVRFIVAGEGARMQFLEENVEKFGLENVELVGLQDRVGIRTLIANVDACLTTFLAVPVLETNSPNKFFDALAAGKLCLVNTKGWLKDLVENNACGVYVDPDRADLFPAEIEPFIRNRAMLQAYQQNALLLGKNQFSREKLATRVCDEIENLLA